MNSKNGKDLVILAGPNGAGKSTVASFLIENKSIPAFLNADVIASGLSGNNQAGEIPAGRVMLKELELHLAAGRSVAFETTAAGKSWIKIISSAYTAGYTTTICYVAVRSPEISVQRVRDRVARGGHPISEPVIRRRYQRSLQQFFEVYSGLVDYWYFFDNSNTAAELVAMKQSPTEPVILNYEVFDSYRKSALAEVEGYKD